MAHLGWSPAKPTPRWASPALPCGACPCPDGTDIAGCLHSQAAASGCCPLDCGVLLSVRRGTCIAPPPSAWWMASSPDTTPRCSPTGPQVLGVSGGVAGGAGSLAAQAPDRCGCGRCALGPGSWHSSLGGRGRSLSQTGRGAQRGTVAAPSTQPSPCGSTPGSAWSAPAPPVQMGKLRP